MSNCTRCGTEIHPEVTSTICVSCIQKIRLVTLNSTYGKFGYCKHVWKVEGTVDGDQVIQCIKPLCRMPLDMHDAAKRLNELEGKL
jgi:hypothetical protein